MNGTDRKLSVPFFYGNQKNKQIQANFFIDNYIIGEYYNHNNYYSYLITMNEDKS